MIALDSQEVGDILQRVLAWTPQARLTLARRILESLETQPMSSAMQAGKRGPPVENLIGMGAGEGPPPNDDEVEQWIDEHRSEEQ